LLGRFGVEQLMSIPMFDHNLVLPPHRGSPTLPQDVSPYRCTTVELCQRFSFSAERRQILRGLLRFRSDLDAAGLVSGFQWLDGSFVEDIETSESRAPRDLDIVTIYSGYGQVFQAELVARMLEFADSALSKSKYSLDHYPVDAGHSPELTVELTRYWIQLFSHNRRAVWKGMLRIELNTPVEDAEALQVLEEQS
jgi:hypothetical protein